MSSDVLVQEERSVVLPGVRPRIAALDMTKGVLVIAMVIYHSLNYSTDYTLGFKYLPFLPPSFIFITGFLIGRLYLNQECAWDVKCHLRLLLRGLRLLAVFTLLNVAINLAGASKWQGQPRNLVYMLDYWVEIYGIGGAGYATFSILLPIAYLLLLAPILMLLDRVSRFLIIVLAGALAVVYAFSGEGVHESVNLALVSAGMVGVALGQIPAAFLEKMGRFWFIAVAVYVGTVAMTGAGWRTPFDQLLNACLAVCAIFSVCAALDPRSFLSRRLVMMGKYSLLAYILQIAVLQGLAKIFGRLEPFSTLFFAQMLGVTVLMVGVAEGLNWARSRSAVVDTPYRVIFG